MKNYLQVGYSFFDSKAFTESDLKNMAAQCGDMNFVHHDNLLASNTRFSGVIASGSAISAIFSAMIPTHYSQFTPMLGLEI